MSNFSYDPMAFTANPSALPAVPSPPGLGGQLTPNALGAQRFLDVMAANRAPGVSPQNPNVANVPNNQLSLGLPQLQAPTIAPPVVQAPSAATPETQESFKQAVAAKTMPQVAIAAQDAQSTYQNKLAEAQTGINTALTGKEEAQQTLLKAKFETQDLMQKEISDANIKAANIDKEVKDTRDKLTADIEAKRQRLNEILAPEYYTETPENVQTRMMDQLTDPSIGFNLDAETARGLISSPNPKQFAQENGLPESAANMVALTKPKQIEKKATNFWGRLDEQWQAGERGTAVAKGVGMVVAMALSEIGTAIASNRRAAPGQGVARVQNLVDGIIAQQVKAKQQGVLQAQSALAQASNIYDDSLKQTEAAKGILYNNLQHRLDALKLKTSNDERTALAEQLKQDIELQKNQSLMKVADLETRDADSKLTLQASLATNRATQEERAQVREVEAQQKILEEQKKIAAVDLSKVPGITIDPEDPPTENDKKRFQDNLVPYISMSKNLTAIEELAKSSNIGTKLDRSQLAEIKTNIIEFQTNWNKSKALGALDKGTQELMEKLLSNPADITTFKTTTLAQIAQLQARANERISGSAIAYNYSIDIPAVLSGGKISSGQSSDPYNQYRIQTGGR